MKKKMSIKEFNEGFKLFKRFLKERGQYISMVKYLFPNGRSKNDMYKDIINCDYFNNCGMNMGDILHITNALGPSFQEKGLGYWEKNIQGMSTDWMLYFSSNKSHRND